MIQAMLNPKFAKKSKHMLLARGITILSVIFYGSSVSAQRAVLDVRGCGTGCRVETIQLSRPSKMNDGWSKVLVKETWIEQDLNGVDSINNRYGGQYWFFAECQQGLTGEGMKSNRRDASITSIYTVDGLRKDVTASGNLYERWEKLCKATVYK
jgi:hypothetical protein